MQGLILDFGGVLAGPGSDMGGPAAIIVRARLRGVRSMVGIHQVDPAVTADEISILLDVDRDRTQGGPAST